MLLAGKGALAKGKVGIEFTKEQAYQFARETGLILLAVMKQELGTLRRVKRVVKVLEWSTPRPISRIIRSSSTAAPTCSSRCSAKTGGTRARRSGWGRRLAASRSKSK